MQTFLPYSDFERSARCLDIKRLGKQRVEVIQVVRALTRPSYGWAHHPAVLMWKGHEEALGRYGLTVCDVWVESGFGDTCAATIRNDLAEVGIDQIRTQADLATADALPQWLGNDDVHRSHRCALVRKDPDFYAPVFPDAGDDVNYVWPVRSDNAVQLELKKAENARLRAERAVLRAEREARRVARRRSLAAKKAWKTRRAAGGTS